MTEKKKVFAELRSDRMRFYLRGTDECVGGCRDCPWQYKLLV